MEISFLFYGCGKEDSVKSTTADDMTVTDAVVEKAVVWEAAEKTVVGQTMLFPVGEKLQDGEENGEADENAPNFGYSVRL